MTADRYDPLPASTPDWYDPDTEFCDPRYALALRIGNQAGSVSSNWHRVESVLRDVWVVLHEGLTWEQARPAIYHGWLQVKRSPRAD
jgi:hypothetical protein